MSNKGRKFWSEAQDVFCECVQARTLPKSSWSEELDLTRNPNDINLRSWLSPMSQARVRHNWIL